MKFYFTNFKNSKNPICYFKFDRWEENLILAQVPSAFNCKFITEKNRKYSSSTRFNDHNRLSLLQQNDFYFPRRFLTHTYTLFSPVFKPLPEYVPCSQLITLFRSDRQSVVSISPFQPFHSDLSSPTIDRTNDYRIFINYSSFFQNCHFSNQSSYLFFEAINHDP